MEESHTFFINYTLLNPQSLSTLLKTIVNLTMLLNLKEADGFLTYFS